MSALERRAEFARRVREAESLSAQLESMLAPVHAVLPPPGSDRRAELLLSITRVVAGLVVRSPGADVIVSVGPEHDVGVRLAWADGAPSANVVNTVALDAPDTAGVDVHVPEEPVAISDERATVAAVATLLWSGQLESGRPGTGEGAGRVAVSPRSHAISGRTRRWRS